MVQTLESEAQWYLYFFYSRCQIKKKAYSTQIFIQAALIFFSTKYQSSIITKSHDILINLGHSVCMPNNSFLCSDFSMLLDRISLCRFRQICYEWILSLGNQFRRKKTPAVLIKEIINSDCYRSSSYAGNMISGISCRIF